MNTQTRRVALVTGASRGIGAAIARRLAADGLAVIVNYRSNADAAAAVVAAIRDAGGEASAIAGDVADEAAAMALVEAAHARWGRLDVVVNNAGVITWGPAAMADRATFKDLIATNLWGTIVVSREALRHLPAGGRIVNMASVVATWPFPMCSLYAASKGGVESYTRVLATEVGARQITVNALEAGYIATDMTAGTPPEQQAITVAMTPMGRLGQPSDVAAAVAWLVSPDAGFITGQVIRVTGGLGG